MLGEDDGCLDGLDVTGDLDGDLDGEFEGLLVFGACEGASDGLAEGDPLGLTDGIAVVGSLDGACDGVSNSSSCLSRRLKSVSSSFSSLALTIDKSANMTMRRTAVQYRRIWVLVIL